eukprot:3855884-Prymnesium_polylepis.1
MANPNINEYVEVGPLALGHVKLLVLSGRARKIKNMAGKWLGVIGGDGEDIGGRGGYFPPLMRHSL